MNEFADWTRGFALLGWDGSAYVPVGVNADGKLEIIAMGEDAGGSPLPLLVDASGRVIMVAYGTINVAGTSTVTQVDKDREVQGADGETLRTLAVDANGQLIMVPRGQGGNYLTIDSDGYMTTVIKGDDAGTLRTVALDAEGRLSAYIIDSSDAWGTFLAVGNAELAVRLGSPVIYHPTGRTVWIETFKHGASQWDTGYSGAGYSVALAADVWLSDGYSLKLVAGSTDSEYVYVLRRFSWLPVSKIGFAFAYCAPAAWLYTTVEFMCLDGAYRHEPALKLNYAAGKVQIWNAGYQDVDVATISVATVTLLDWNEVKITIDLDAHTYDTLYFRGNTYDISGTSYPYAEDTVAPVVGLHVRHYGRSGNNDYIYLDNLIYTVAEE